MKQMELEVARDAAMEVVQPGKTIASHMFRMPHGASTVWHTVLNLTGMRGVTYPRSLASPRFDFCFTKSLDEADMEADVSSSTWLVMTDSHSGYLQRCLLRCKS